MSQLDKLIERIQPTQELLLESKREPTMRSSTGLKVMVNQQLTSSQIIALLADLAPSAQRQNFAQKKPTTFEYALGDKLYTVSFLTQGELVRGVISQVEAAGPGSPAALSDTEEGDDEFVEVISEQSASAPMPADRSATGEPEVNSLLRKMVQMGASDLHLTSGHKPMIRLHGDMQELPNQPVITPDRMKKLVYAITPSHNTAQYEDIHDTDYAHEITNVARFRVNVFRQRAMCAVVMRVIPNQIPTFESLGLPAQLSAIVPLRTGLLLSAFPPFAIPPLHSLPANLIR
jgi:twitching motility protein PilT